MTQATKSGELEQQKTVEKPEQLGIKPRQLGVYRWKTSNKWSLLYCTGGFSGRSTNQTWGYKPGIMGTYRDIHQ